MDMRPVSSADRRQVNAFLSSRWFSTEMVVSGEMIDTTLLDGFAVYENGEIIGLVTYRINGDSCEIISLDSVKEGRGIGTALMNKAVERAAGLGCRRVKLITTNDNINAIRFYQRRGFDMARLYHNALDVSRSKKPSIPMIGEFGIPLKHEIEFEMKLPER